MEAGTMNVSQNFGIAAYQGRMVVEVLTCVNNLQSRCDMMEDATAILGCAACCAGIDNTSNGSLLENSLHEDLSYPDVVTQYPHVITDAVGGQEYAHVGGQESPHVGGQEYPHVITDAVGGQEDFDKRESSQRDSSSSPTPSAVNREPPSASYVSSQRPNAVTPSASYAKRLRKRLAGSSEEENPKKKGKVTHTESTTSASSEPPGTNSGMRIRISGPSSQGDKEKMKTAKPRKGKDSLIVGGKSAEQNLLPRASSQQSVADEGIDAETEALEFQQCVSLLKSYGIIENRDLHNTEALLHRVPHPGFAGDGSQSKTCKICGAIEDLHNTVFCDECQEAFHLSCTRMTPKYFKREDNWFCVSCRKQKKKMGSKLIERGSCQEDNSSKGSASNESKARLGSAHQADVPEWQNRANDDDAERSAVGSIGTEMRFSEEQKAAERDHLLRTFKDKVESLGWLPADKLPNGTPQNWVKCNNIVVRAYKDPDGKKHNEIVCGKWRRAPLNVVQADNWECFCAMEWDPLHADCAIPQECSDEEVLTRLSNRMQIHTDGHAPEVGNRKATLRPGKFVL